jgi:hypothetical protein
MWDRLISYHCDFPFQSLLSPCVFKHYRAVATLHTGAFTHGDTRSCTTASVPTTTPSTSPPGLLVLCRSETRGYSVPSVYPEATRVDAEPR